MPRGQLQESARALSSNLRNPLLLRAQLAFGAAFSAEWAFTVALSVVAYEHGGAAAVGVVSLVRMAPAALLSPFAAALADRLARDLVLVWTSAVRALTTVAAAIVLAAGGSVVVVYLLAVVATAAFTAFRPAHSALLPSLCRSPGELTSANVVRGLLDSCATLFGPALAAVLLAAGSPTAVLLAAALLAGVAAALLVRFDYERPPRPAAPAPLRAVAREVRAGAAAAWQDPRIRLITGLTCVQTFTRGALGVLLVVIAIELLRAGDSAVGTLTAALGAGALAGSLAAAAVVGRGALASTFGIGVALWGLPIAIAAALPEWAPVLALLALIGVGNALVDVGLFTLLARLPPEHTVARIFGVLESALTLAVGLGGAVTPLALGLAGTRGAMVALGLAGPLATLLAWRHLRRLDHAMLARDAEIELLRAVPMLRVLPMPAIEELALRARPATVHAGELVFAQGDDGEGFYVIVGGAAEVLGDGRHVRALGPGDGFGEIALLRSCPRTATVRATTDLGLRVIDRPAFLGAVTGYRSAAEEADALAGARLASFGAGRSAG